MILHFLSSEETRDVVTLTHGAGGSVMQNLIRKRIATHFGRASIQSLEVSLDAFDDAAIVNGVVFTTDSYTVRPLFFPGGDIGALAVAGTVNDVAVMGGEPTAISLALIIEEGFAMSDLERIIESVASMSERAGVRVVTGDTKVVERGSLEGLLINTSGIGFESSALMHNAEVVNSYRHSKPSRWLLDSNVQPGDKIMVSGYIADHGVAIMSVREGYSFKSGIVSDVAPINGLMRKVLETGGVVAAKDPTRGGIANLLNEWSEKSRIGVDILETEIPVRPQVSAALDLLGIDPLVVGNEGKVVIAVVPECAGAVLEAMRSHPEGRNASIIGEATSRHEVVAMRTVVGGSRIIPSPAGDPVPRIC